MPRTLFHMWLAVYSWGSVSTILILIQTRTVKRLYASLIETENSDIVGYGTLVHLCGGNVTL